MKIFRKFFYLCLFCLLGLVQVKVAEGEEDYGIDLTNSSVNVYAVNNSYIIAGGICGPNTEWELKSDGRLIISGSGETYNYTNNNRPPWMEYRIDITELQILNGVTSLGDAMFYNCNLQRVMISDTVTSIGNYTFRDCSALSNITIPSSITRIGEWAFYCCENLVTISIPANVKEIGEGAFAGCTGLISATINGGLTKIPAYLFNDCTILTTVILPNSVTSIEAAAFDSCINLSGLTFPSNLEIIEEAAFGNCKNLKSISIPDSVTFINSAAFGDCTGLKYIELSNRMTAIPDAMLSGCKSLKTIVIPSNITSIGMGAFAWCSALEKITIPASVASIGEMAFIECSLLQEIRILNPKVSIGNYIIERSENIKVIYGFSNSMSEILANKYSVPFVAFDSEENYMLNIKGDNIVYDGYEKEPKVLLYFNGERLVDGINFVIRYSNNVNAGSGNIVVIGKGEYDIVLNSTFEIKRKSIKDLKIEVLKQEYTYDGKAKLPNIIIEDYEQLEKDEDYSIIYLNNINAGIGKIEINGIGNYCGKVIEKFNINKAKPIIVCTNIIEKVLDAPSFYIQATVSSKGIISYTTKNESVVKLTKNGNVEIVGIGKATIEVSVLETNNYVKAKRKIDIIVNPNKTKKFKIKAYLKGSILMTWEKDKYVNGYEIYYSMSQNFNKNTKRFIIKNDDKYFKKALVGLDSKKKYFVKIRSYKKINGKKYFSSWSNIKSVKTK